jgi:hypothetical protein
MTKKKTHYSAKNKKSSKKGNTIYYLIIILIIIGSAVGIYALQSHNNTPSQQQPSKENDGTWIFALDTSTAYVSGKEAYRTGYIPTLVIIDINGNIIHKSAGVHEKQTLLDLVEEAQQPGSSTNLGSAPDFTLETFGGKQFKLSSYKGTPVILDLMAVRCPPCHQQMPELYEVKKELGDDVVILSIDVDAAGGTEDKEDVTNAFGEYISEE